MPELDAKKTAAVKEAASAAVDADVDGAADEADMPTDPAELRAYAKRIRGQLRKAERKLDDAGLTRKEERRLTDEVALLSGQLEAIAAKLEVRAPAAVTPAVVETPREEEQKEEADWCPTLL